MPMPTVNRRWFAAFALMLGSVCAPDLSSAQSADRAGREAGLPDWLWEHRVQAQTGRYHFSRSGRAEREMHELAVLGAAAVTRHVKLDWRPPVWPSAVPVDADGNALLADRADVLGELVAANHAEGMRFIAYYWESGEGVLGDDAALDPRLTGYGRETYRWRVPDDWLCRDLAGDPMPVLLGQGRPVRGYYLDLTSGYRHFLLQRFVEMVEAGVDALYFDERHLPREQQGACFGSRIAADFIAQGGRLPRSTDWNDPDYRRYVDFQGRAMARAFDWLRSALHDRFPDRNVPFVISTSYLSALTLPHMHSSLASVADLPKVEILNGIRDGLNGRVLRDADIPGPARDIGIALGMLVPRDANRNRAFHAWHRNFRTVDEIRAYVATVLAYGGIAALAVPPQYLDGRYAARDDGGLAFDTPYPVLQAGFRFGEQVAPLVRGLRPAPRIGVYFSETQRNRYPSLAAAWIGHLTPMTDAVAALIRHGLPVGVITDDQVSTLTRNEYDDVIVPADSLVEFQARRGPRADAGPRVHTWPADGYDGGALVRALEQSARLQVVLPPESKAHAVYHADEASHATVLLVTDFSALGAGDYQPPTPLDGAELRVRGPEPVAVWFDGGSGRRQLEPAERDENVTRYRIPRLNLVGSLKIID